MTVATLAKPHVRRASDVELYFYQPRDLRTREDALDVLEGEVADTLRTLVDMLAEGRCPANPAWTRHALEGMMLEDLAALVELLAEFLREERPRPIQFAEPEQSQSYVRELKRAFKAVERSDGLPTSAPLIFCIWQRAKRLRAREEVARSMRGERWLATEGAR